MRNKYLVILILFLPFLIPITSACELSGTFYIDSTCKNIATNVKYFGSNLGACVMGYSAGTFYVWQGGCKAKEGYYSSPTDNGQMCGRVCGWLCNAYIKSGKYDKSENKCVSCSNAKQTEYIEITSSGDPSETPSNQCESACGANAACDDKTPDSSLPDICGVTTLEVGRACSSTCEYNSNSYTCDSTYAGPSRQCGGATYYCAFTDNIWKWSTETPDTTPPTVSISHSPSSPTPDDSIKLTVTASDTGSGLKDIKIYWKKSTDSNYNTYSCTSSPCEKDIAKFPSGTVINYYAEASDNQGNVGRDPLIGASPNYKTINVQAVPPSSSSTSSTTLIPECKDCNNAKQIGTGDTVSTCALSKAANKPYDFFYFVSPRNGFIVVKMEDIQGSGSNLDLDLVIHSQCQDSPYDSVECMSKFPGSDTCLVKTTAGSYKIRVWDCSGCPGEDKTAKITLNFYDNLNGFGCNANDLKPGLILLKSSKYKNINVNEQFTLSALTTSNCNGKTVIFTLEPNSIRGSCTLNSNGECFVQTSFSVCNAPSGQVCSAHFNATLDLNGNGKIDNGEPVSNRIEVLVNPGGGGGGSSSSSSSSTTTTRPTGGSTTSTTQPGGTTTTTTTTTTTIPQNIQCDECLAKSKCKCTLTGSCSSGLWVLQNKEGSPLDSAISSQIPPSTIEFVPDETGKITVGAFCFHDTTTDTITPYILEVKEPFLECDEECTVNKNCQCSVTGCSNGEFTAIAGTKVLKREETDTTSYTANFIPETSDTIDVTANCVNPSRVAEKQITVSGGGGETPGKKFSVSSFRSQKTGDVHKLTLNYVSTYSEDVIIVFTISKNGEAINKKTYAASDKTSLSVNVDCSDLNLSGTYSVSWKAFRSSDKQRPIIWSKPEEMESIAC